MSNRSLIRKGVIPLLLCPLIAHAQLPSASSSVVGTRGVSTMGIASLAHTTVKYSFSGPPRDGQYPEVGLLQGSDGKLYGTTGAGGNDGGTAFVISSRGAETVLHLFGDRIGDGSGPSGLIQGSDGNFYGVTELGGAHGDGTVFEITPSGTETVLHSFVGGERDGLNPGASLLQGSDGDFYGTTNRGGKWGDGTVFKITPSGTETVLYSFAGASKDGAYPLGGLIQDRDGNLYGTTFFGGAFGLAGGASGDGTVFKIARSGTEIVLHSFAGGGNDGSGPGGLTRGSDGDFYGTTVRGGADGDGTVFRMTPSGTVIVLHSFAGGGSDGLNPSARLIRGGDGDFYGTTDGGGAYGDGTVFKITPGGTETVLYSFSPPSGALPFGGVIQGSDGNLYGTTTYGGAFGDGTVFETVLR